MAELVMDDPLAVSPSRQLAKCVQDIADCIGLMRNENADSGSPINEDSSALQRFCVKLEHVLQLGQRARRGVFAKQKTYWDYIVACKASGNKQLTAGFAYVKSQSELRTSIGRGRAFLRFSLQQKCLADSLQQCWATCKVTNEWFHAQSIWRSQNLFMTLMSVLYDLNDVPFDLSLQGYDLDTSWPTFSRNSHSGSNRTWCPPSRSISISSFENSFSLLPDSSLPDHSPIDCLLKREEVMATRSVEELEKAVALAERLVEEYKAEMADLQKQVNTKSDLWTEKEASLQKQLSSYKDIIEKLRARSKSASADGTTVSSDELGLHVEYSAALEAELESVQQDLAGRKEVDNKKTKLIEQLDSRVSQLEKRLKGLMSLLETCCRGNDEKTEQLTTAATTVTFLTQELEENQNVRKAQEKTIKELRVMLHSVEDKGSKIGQLAKEKLTKYSADNKQLTQTLADKETELAQIKAQLEEIGVSLPFMEQPVRSPDYTDGQSETATWSSVDEEQIVREYEENIAKILAESGAEVRVKRTCANQTELRFADYDEIVQDRGKMATTVSELRHDLSQYEIKCTRHKDEISEMRTLCDQRGAQELKLTADLQILQGQLSAVEERNRKLDLELSRVKRDASNMADEATAILSQDVSRVTSELAAVRDLLALKETELLTSKAMCQQELSALKFQHSSEQMQYSQTLKNFTSQQDDICHLMEKVTEQEVTINTLEMRVEQLQQDLGVEKEQKIKALSDMRHELDLRTNEMESFSKQLEESQQNLAEKDLALVSIQASIEGERVKEKELQRSLEQRIETLEADNTDLKKRLIQLIRQKDNLWQKTDQLEFQQRQRGETWMLDEVVLNCLSCRVEFSFLLRKHHCRLCGRIYCHDCCAHWIMTAHSSKKERVCESCYLNTSHSAADLSRMDDDSDESELDLLASVEIPQRKSSKWLDIPDLSTSSDEKEDDNDANMEDISDTPPPATEQADTSNVPTPDGDTHDCQQDVTTSTPVLDSSPSVDKLACRSTEVDINGELFDLITDEEVAQSLIESASPHSLSADYLSEVGRYEHEVCVEARGSHEVDVLISQPMTRLFWQFTTESKGINFGTRFRRLHASSPDGATEQLIALCKCNSHKDVVRGDLEARQPGVYTLTFDNTYSRLTSKNLRYELSVRLP